jgi:hypothetical protein
MATKKKQSKLSKKYALPLWQIIAFVLVFAAVGVYALVGSNAATKRSSGGKTSGTLHVSVIASTKSPGYSLMHITGCGYSPTAYVSQFNYKYLDAASGWASFGSLPVNSSGCIDYTDTDNGVVLRKFTPGNYTAYITQKTVTSRARTVATTNFVIGSNGLTQ